LRAVLAEALRRTGDLARAETAAAEALRLSPEDADALVIGAELRLDRGAAGEARALLERALLHEPGRLDALLGLAAADFAEGRALDAEARLAEILRVQPRYAGVYRVRGEHLERIGDRQGAVRAYRQALAVQPDDRRAREGLRRLLGR
jgi:Putative Zn-dependent protease, contains TPR repeats